LDENTWSIDEGLSGQVFQTGRPYFESLPEYLDGKTRSPFAKLAVDAGIECAGGFPVLVGNEVVAVLIFGTTESQRPDSSFLDVMTDVGIQLGRVVERERAVKALREREATISAMVETSRDWIWAIDLEGIHTYCNPAVEAILGYRPEELVGKSSIDLVHEEDRSMVETEFPKWIAERCGWNNLVIRWRHKDGGWRYLESNAVPIVSASGELVGFRGVDRDISERIESEEKLRRMEVQLTHVSRLSTMGEMMAGIAHEVAQPLHAIVNFARATGNVLDADKEPNLENLRDWNAAIVDAATLASEVVKRMRGFARRGKPIRSKCAINEIVRESVQIVTLEARRCGAAVRLELPDSSPLVNVDRVQIQQALVNLLHNAFEALAEAECGVREVTICVEPAEQSIRVSVMDTGPGVPPSDDLDVFEPFATTKGDGLGLGLVISSSIIEAHEGALWADSEVTAGATFHFTLPAFRKEFTDGD
jgi:PAS domain S-box-containing protein